MTFVQALTEAVRRTAESMLLISVPESDIEVGGEAGKAALNTLSHIIGRIESVWKPVTTVESFEMVRRRLFTSQVDYAARDAVINAFGDMYRNAAGEFSSLPGLVNARAFPAHAWCPPSHGCGYPPAVDAW